MRIKKQNKKARKSIIDTSENEGTLMKQLAQTRHNPYAFRTLIANLISTLQTSTMLQAITRGRRLVQQFLIELALSPPPYTFESFLSLYAYIYKVIKQEHDKEWEDLERLRGPGGREMYWVDKKYLRAETYFRIGEEDFRVFLKEREMEDMWRGLETFEEDIEEEDGYNWGEAPFTPNDAKRKRDVKVTPWTPIKKSQVNDRVSWD